MNFRSAPDFDPNLLLPDRRRAAEESRAGNRHVPLSSVVL